MDRKVLFNNTSLYHVVQINVLLNRLNDNFLVLHSVKLIKVVGSIALEGQLTVVL